MNGKNKEIIESIGSDSIELLSDYAEIGIDTIINSDILKDIPIFGSLVKLSHIGLSIRDNLFIEKLKVFLFSLNKIPIEERRRFIESNIKDNKIEDLGEKLINVLDKIDSNIKARYIAKAFELYITQQIDSIEFYDLVYSIENFKIHYSDIFIENCINIESVRLKNSGVDHFMTCGLFKNDGSDEVYIYSDDEPRYRSTKITKIGKIFLEKILEYDKEKLKSTFIEKILNLNPNSEINSKQWIFIREETPEQLRQRLYKKTLREFLKIQYHDSLVTISTKDVYIREGIFKNSTNENYSIYNSVNVFSQ